MFARVNLRHGYRDDHVALSRNALEPWVQKVPEPVAEDVHGKHSEQNCQTWKRRQPPRAVQQGLALGKHRSPGRRRWLNAESKKTQRCLDEDHLRDRKGV